MKMTHRNEGKTGDRPTCIEMLDEDNKRVKIEKRKKRFSSSSCSSSSDSSSDSVTSSCSSSSNSTSGSSSRSSSSSSSTSSNVHDIKRKKLVQEVQKTTSNALVTSEKKAKPVKKRQENTKKLENVKPKAEPKKHPSPRQKRVRQSPSPRSTKIHIGRLTRNITREHIQEIFSSFGKIKFIDFPMDRIHYTLGKGFAYAEFETESEAENAMKHMDGAQIDGQEITAAPVLVPKPRQVIVRRRSPVPVSRTVARWRRPPIRYQRWKSPLHRRRPRSLSRSPARRRRYNRSSSSKSL